MPTISATSIAWRQLRLDQLPCAEQLVVDLDFEALFRSSEDEHLLGGTAEIFAMYCSRQYEEVT
jgi:hypothetical protein